MTKQQLKGSSTNGTTTANGNKSKHVLPRVNPRSDVGKSLPRAKTSSDSTVKANDSSGKPKLKNNKSSMKRLYYEDKVAEYPSDDDFIAPDHRRKLSKNNGHSSLANGASSGRILDFDHALHANKHGRHGDRESSPFDFEVTFASSRHSDAHYDQTHLWAPLLQAIPHGPYIEVFNDVDDVGPPSDFKFISASFHGDGVPAADDGFLVGCECRHGSGCHRAKDKTCSCQDSLGAQGVLPYDEDGCVVLPERSAIVECNPSCACDVEECKNRVIQKGSQCRFQIFRTKGRGWGVRTLDPIHRGQYVEQYVGEIISNSEADLRGHRYDELGCTYLFDMDYFYDTLVRQPGNSDENVPIYIIDAWHYGNVTHFFNHSCDSNLSVHPYFGECADPRFHGIAFFANRDIKAGEELCFDYSGGSIPNDDAKQKGQRRKGSSKKLNEEDVGDDKTVYKYIQCLCGSSKCRKRFRM